MILNNILLINFRNYKKFKITFYDGINIIIGKNGVGKTNILEAIYVLGLTKSYKNYYNDKLIKIGEDNFKLSGNFSLNNHHKNLEIINNKNIKKVYENNNNIKKLSDYIGIFKVIMYSPSDNQIITGSPTLRRSLIDTSLSQKSKFYLNTLNEYNKILKLRNDYIRELSINGNADRRYLDILTEELVPRAVIIYKMRLEFIEKINKILKKISSKITIGSDIYIEYNFSGNINDISEENILKVYKDFYLKELNNGLTYFGPHRDDIIFYFDSNDMKNYSSQGQQKLAILCYKFAEMIILKNEFNDYPCLLLDDLFSEIDKQRLTKVINFLINIKDIQVIITSNDTIGISKRILNNAKIHEIF